MYSAVDLCVLCLTCNENRKSILSQDNEGIVIEEKFKFILNENVNIKQEVSFICLHCLKNLNYAYHFKQMCLQNINTFNSYVVTLETNHLKVTLTDLQNQRTNELTCDSESVNEISPPIEVVLIKKEIVDNCVLQDDNVIKEDEAMDENDEFSAQVNPENINDNIQYSSSLNEENNIMENFLNRVKKETDLDLIHEEIEIKDVHLFEVIDSDSKDKYGNKLQNNETKKPDNFNEKIDSELSAANNCDLSSIDSNYDNNDKIQLNLSMDEINLEQNKKISKNCNSTLSEAGKNRGWDQNVGSAKWYKCDECHKEYPFSSDLKIHSRTHTGERPFECTTCKRSFTTIGNLNKHNRLHTDEKPFECDLCHKKFFRNNQLIIHKRTHNNERPFKCSACPWTFTNRGSLTSHMLIHTGVKPYKCQICQYKCTKSGHLKRHMRIHTGEKPFTCIRCQKQFSCSTSLKRHMQTKHDDKI